MNRKNLLLGVFLMAASFAHAASSYKFTVTSPVMVGDTQLKPGNYKVTVEGDKAVIKNGAETVSVPAAIESGDKKYQYTTLSANGNSLNEIRLGGTSSKIVIKSGSSVAGK